MSQSVFKWTVLKVIGYNTSAFNTKHTKINKIQLLHKCKLLPGYILFTPLSWNILHASHYNNMEPVTHSLVNQFGEIILTCNILKLHYCIVLLVELKCFAKS